VRVKRRFPHLRYHKVVTAYKKFTPMMKKGEAKPGDRVRIEETRPLSKIKCWRLLKIVEAEYAEPSAEVDRILCCKFFPFDVADNTARKSLGRSACWAATSVMRGLAI